MQIHRDKEWINGYKELGGGRNGEFMHMRLLSGAMEMFWNLMVAMVARLCEHRQNYWIVHFKRVDLMVCVLYLYLSKKKKKKGNADSLHSSNSWTSAEKFRSVRDSCELANTGSHSQGYYTCLTSNQFLNKTGFQIQCFPSVGDKKEDLGNSPWTGMRRKRIHHRKYKQS